MNDTVPLSSVPTVVNGLIGASVVLMVDTEDLTDLIWLWREPSVDQRIPSKKGGDA